MELTVYRQAQRVREDGTVVYKGEDALPYVDDGLFFVADGLGGAGSIYHKSINPGMLDPEKLLRVLFQGIYKDWSNEKFKKYIQDSFRELFVVAHCYTDNLYNVKKSGYFGSRIVPAIILHEYLYGGIFENLTPYFDFCGKKEKTIQQKKQMLAELGSELADKIKKILPDVAKNANLVYESRIPDLALLATTLCATFYREREDVVEALYFTAGDSRCYVWTEDQGLCQLMEDQEHPDGGMTNYIKANGEFSIRCNYGRFQKPCILFNASDGCFDSGYFPSPMAFEQLILEKAMESSDEEEMGRSLEEIFQTYGTHDDSSTIAMKMYGYGSFGDLKDSVQRRLNTIQSNYLEKMPDLLEHNYGIEYEALKSRPVEDLKGLKPMFEAEPDILWPYCDRAICAEHYAPYELEIKKIEQNVNQAKNRKKEYQNEVEKIIKGYYVLFTELIGHDLHLTKRIQKQKIKDAYRKAREASETYRNMRDGYFEGMAMSIKEITSVMEQVRKVDIPHDVTEFDDISLGQVEKCQRFMDGLFRFLEEIRQHKQKEVNLLIKASENCKEQNCKMAEPQVVLRIYDMLVAGKINMNYVARWMGSADFDLLQGMLEKIRNQEKAAHFGDVAGRNALEQCHQAYWDANYMTLMKQMIIDPKVCISAKLRQKAEEVLGMMGAKEQGLKQKSEQQTKLFEVYDIGYGRYMKGDLDDGTWL